MRNFYWTPIISSGGRAIGRSQTWQPSEAPEPRGYNFTGNGAPQRISAARVTGNFLDVLRVQPFIGRNFTAEEDSPGGGLTIVLSYPFWMHQFAGERSAIGSKVVLDDQPYTVIGVLPKQFVFPGDLECDALVAQQLNAALDRKQGRALHGIGRLKPGVTIEQARSDIDRLLADAHRRFPFFYRSDNHAVVVPLQEHETGRAKLLLMVLFAAVGFVLLIACSNVATLLLTRTAGRQREIAVRLALGASRARLLRQFIMESSVLSCAGGLIGVLFAVGLVRVFRAYGSGQIPRAAPFRWSGEFSFLPRQYLYLQESVWDSFPR